MSALIIPFRRRSQIGVCPACFTHFQLNDPHQVYCRDCIQWDRALTCIAAAHKALNELRDGGRR